MSNWIQWRLTVPQEQAESCAELLMEVGCGGSQIEDVQLVFDESEDATFMTRDDAVVTGFYEAIDPATLAETEFDLQQALQNNGITARLERTAVDDTDWSEKWRENFPPLAIGRFLIIPSWEVKTTPETDAISIRIDPGLAFGTGQHPTTHMCLELIGERLPAGDTPEGESPRVLDVGCGSGILSIAAAKLGSRVWGSDLDPWCVRATAENAADNKVEVEVVEAAGLDWATESFPIVVANLMSSLLISLSPQLARVTAPGGLLIVSGISEPRADEVAAAFTEAGFTQLERRERDGDTRGDFLERWAAFVFKRNED